MLTDRLRGRRPVYPIVETSSYLTPWSYTAVLAELSLVSLIIRRLPLMFELEPVLKLML